MQGLKDIFPISEFKELASVRIEHIKEISIHVSAIKQQVKDMINARKKANLIGSQKEKAFEYEKNVRFYFDKIRYHIDKLEMMCFYYIMNLA